MKQSSRLDRKQESENESHQSLINLINFTHQRSDNRQQGSTRECGKLISWRKTSSLLTELENVFSRSMFATLSFRSAGG